MQSMLVYQSSVYRGRKIKLGYQVQRKRIFYPFETSKVVWENDVCDLLATAVCLFFSGAGSESL